MDNKKFILNSVIAGVLFFILGWLVYGILLDSYFQHHTGEIGLVNRKEMMMLYLVAGSLLQGAMLAYILIRASVNTLKDGCITGGIVGFLLAASFDTIMYATTIIISKRGALADIIAFTIICAVIGAVLGMLAGKNKPAAA